MRTQKLWIACPVCEKDLQVEYTPGIRGTRWTPPDAPEVEIVQQNQCSCELSYEQLLETVEDELYA